MANDLFTGDNEKFLTDPVFLIGNGKSRTQFNLERLKKVGTVIGCNAIYREFNPDILIAIDSKMLNELKKANYKSSMIIVPHNRSIALPNAHKYKTQRYNTSGAFAMRLIKDSIQPERCYMLGMDGYPGNVFDGTTNYAAHTLKNFDGVHRFYLEILEQSKKTVFINVNDIDAWPPQAENTGAYSRMTYELFEKIVM